MGRKPNPVVASYFTRGSKIDDASNRYQFTCKQCGERFPKGRIESLYNHITKKCTASSLQAKNSISRQIHKLGLAADTTASRNKPKAHRGKNAGLPLSSRGQQNSNGLNVLAEASCQLVATTTHGYSPSNTAPATNRADVVVGSTVLDPALENETFPSSAIRSVETDRPGQKNAISSRASSGNNVVPFVPACHQNSSDNSQRATKPHADGLLSRATSAAQHATLTSIAASADATLGHKIASNAADPISENRPLSSTFPVPAATVSRRSYIRLLPAVAKIHDGVQHGNLLEHQTAANFPRPIAINPRSSISDLPLEYCHVSSHQRLKVPGEDAEARKKDIQKMRKLGSCIRCRMLRKPCSEITPCVTCRAIDSPRSWKGFRCLRAKLVDLSHGYMPGLYQKLCSHDVNAAKSTMGFVPDPDDLLVKYFEDAEPLELRILGSSVHNCAIDAINPSPSTVPIGQGAPAQIMILDTEANDLLVILEEYIKKHVTRFFEQEASSIVKSAAVLAYELSQDSGDALLNNAVVLWMMTTMLSDPTTWWKIAIPQNRPRGSFMYRVDEAAAGSTVDEQTLRQSFCLISSQLQSGLERLLTKFSSHVLHKFERRLMRPASLNHFETFLMAMILINCIERYSWIFYSWTDEAKADQWPLDQSPKFLIAQAEQVAGVIVFMMKVRNLSPRITEDTAAGILKAEHPNDEKYANWFEERNIAVNLLAQRADAVFDANDCRSLDLKYSATLLLPPQNPSGETPTKAVVAAPAT